MFSGDSMGVIRPHSERREHGSCCASVKKCSLFHRETLLKKVLNEYSFIQKYAVSWSGSASVTGHVEPSLASEVCLTEKISNESVTLLDAERL